MPRFAQRPAPAHVRPRSVPTNSCSSCGSFRYPEKIWGAKRLVYACPHDCDAYDPKRGQLAGLTCPRCTHTRDALRLEGSPRQVFACRRGCDDFTLQRTEEIPR